MIFLLIVVVLFFIIVGLGYSASGAGWITIQDDYTRYHSALEQKCVENPDSPNQQKAWCIFEAIKQDFASPLLDENGEYDYAGLLNLMKKYEVRVFPDEYFMKYQAEISADPEKYHYRAYTLLHGFQLGIEANAHFHAIIANNIIGGVCGIDIVRKYNDYDDNIPYEKIKRISNEIRASTDFTVDMKKVSDVYSTLDMLEGDMHSINYIYMNIYMGDPDPEGNYAYTNHSNAISIDHRRKSIFFTEPHGFPKPGMDIAARAITKELLDEGYTFSSTDIFGVNGLQRNDRHDEGYCTSWVGMAAMLMYMNPQLEQSTVMALLAGMDEDATYALLLIYAKYMMDKMEDMWGTDLYNMKLSRMREVVAVYRKSCIAKYEKFPDELLNIGVAAEAVYWKYTPDTLSDTAIYAAQLIRLYDILSGKPSGERAVKEMMWLLDETENKKRECTLL